MKVTKNKTKKAFTLVEVLLYIAITSTILLAFTGYITTLTGSKSKAQVISSVNQEGLFISQKIKSYVQSSVAVNSPAKNESGSELVLSMADLSTVTIRLNSGFIEVDQGSGFVNISSSRVEVTNLNFGNYSNTNAKDLVSFDFTLTFLSGNNLSEQNYIQNYYGTAAIR